MGADPTSCGAASGTRAVRFPRPLATPSVVLALAFACIGEILAQPTAAERSAAFKNAAQLKPRPPELEGYGEYYDLAKYDACVKKDRRNSRCEIYRLKRIPAPEHWPYHSKPPIKWPAPPKEQVYKPGMGPIEYWRALCKAEAGEFIYRTIPDVKSIYQIRPRPKENEYSGSDRYVREDPYGYISSESGTLDNIPWMVVGQGWASRKSPGGYPNFETPILENDIHRTRQKYFPAELFQSIPDGKPYQSYSGYSNRYIQMKLEYREKVSSRYGWTWRGIKRSFDRVIGVAGGELAVVDLNSGEIIALRRGFILGARQLGGLVGWGGGNACPEYSLMPGIGTVRRRNKDMDFSLWFINKVLLPIGKYRD